MVETLEQAHRARAPGVEAETLLQYTPWKPVLEASIRAAESQR